MKTRWKFCAGTLIIFNILCLVNILHMNHFRLSDVTQSKAYQRHMDIPNNDDVLVESVKPKKWTDQSYCRVTCKRKSPCRYVSEIDFRLIILSHVGTSSLASTLNSILNLDTLGDRVSVEVWVFDTHKMRNAFPVNVTRMFGNFKSNWTDTMKKGRSCIHLQATTLGDKFVNVWSGRKGGEEMALIISDHVILSPHAYHWLKQAHSSLDKNDKLTGYNLLDISTKVNDPSIIETNEGVKESNKEQSSSKTPKQGNVLFHDRLFPDTFSPNGKVWYMFQKWYNSRKHSPTEYSSVLTELSDTVAEYLTDYLKLDSSSPNIQQLWLIWWHQYQQETGIYTAFYNALNSTFAIDSFVDSTVHQNTNIEPNRSNVGLINKWNSNFDNFTFMNISKLDSN